MNWFSVLWKKSSLVVYFQLAQRTFLGREGPSIQLGAAIGQGADNCFGVHLQKEKDFDFAAEQVGDWCSPFNAPIAGLLFVLEEIHHLSLLLFG